jgi:hypothetical protein
MQEIRRKKMQKNAGQYRNLFTLSLSPLIANIILDKSVRPKNPQLATSQEPLLQAKINVDVKLQ